jgi:hypothetical protein
MPTKKFTSKYARDLRRVEAWIEELESWGPEEQGGGGTSSRETP